jgi:hypothetical protein
LGKSILWRGVKFTRIRITEWAAAEYARGNGIKAMTHDGISCFVPPQRIRTTAVIDLTDERLGQSFAEQIKFCGDCAQFYPATPNYFHLHKHGKYGLANTCISCKKQYDRKRYGRKKAQYYQNSRNS